jgi:hypothetical protein
MYFVLPLTIIIRMIMLIMIIVVVICHFTFHLFSKLYHIECVLRSDLCRKGMGELLTRQLRIDTEPCSETGRGQISRFIRCD